MPGVYSHHWDTILDVLEHGPIEDPSGLATEKLRQITGHESTNALVKILRRMEAEGLIERDVNGRRTTRIAAAPQPRRRRVAKTVAAPVAATVTPAEPYRQGTESTNGDGNIDYDLLAAALLAKALKAQQAQELAAGAKDAVARAERAEAARRIAEADAQAARAKVAELEAMVRTMESNMKMLQAQLDKPAVRAGDTIRERLSARERKDLDQLMRALPTVRG